MFSIKRTIFVAASIGLSLTLFAGCKTSETKSTLPPAPATPVVKANPPVPPTPPPSQPTVKLPPDSGDNLAPNILNWNTLCEEYHAKPGEMLAPFTFALTNVSSAPIVIYDTSTTCDCTVASLPSKPWVLASGAGGEIHATIDLTNKVGVVTNQIVVFTSLGNRRLFVKAIAADPVAK
jgi:hypothetical protein